MILNANKTKSNYVCFNDLLIMFDYYAITIQNYKNKTTKKKHCQTFDSIADDVDWLMLWMHSFSWQDSCYVFALPLFLFWGSILYNFFYNTCACVWGIYVGMLHKILHNCRCWFSNAMFYDWFWWVSKKKLFFFKLWGSIWWLKLYFLGCHFFAFSYKAVL